MTGSVWIQTSPEWQDSGHQLRVWAHNANKSTSVEFEPVSRDTEQAAAAWANDEWTQMRAALTNLTETAIIEVEIIPDIGNSTLNGAIGPLKGLAQQQAMLYVDEVAIVAAAGDDLESLPLSCSMAVPPPAAAVWRTTEDDSNDPSVGWPERRSEAAVWIAGTVGQELVTLFGGLGVDVLGAFGPVDDMYFYFYFSLFSRFLSHLSPFLSLFSLSFSLLSRFSLSFRSRFSHFLSHVSHVSSQPLTCFSLVSHLFLTFVTPGGLSPSRRTHGSTSEAAMQRPLEAVSTGMLLIRTRITI